MEPTETDQQVIEKLRSLKDTLERVRGMISAGDLDGASEKAQEISRGYDCEMCEAIETDVYALCLMVSAAPSHRRDDRVRLAKNEIDAYTTQIAGELKAAEKKQS